MSFTDYAGTPWAPWLLPIIPVGATLSKNTSLKAEHLGKIPGLKHGDEWAGFHGWSDMGSISDPRKQAKIFPIWDGWYEGTPPVIGVNSRLWPGVDIDISNPTYAQLVQDAAFRIFGETIVRGRENSGKRLLMYRLDQPCDFITKARWVYRDPEGDEFAIEILGKGQQYLIEGMHKSGVPYVWESGRTPLNADIEEIPKITPAKVCLFFRELDALLCLFGCERIRSSGSPDRDGGTNAINITPAHPEVAPSLDLLKDLLENYLAVDCCELADYGAWETALRAIKTACAANEEFYNDVVLPWNLKNPTNEEEVVRAKWESHKSSSVGWDYLCGLARGYGFAADIRAQFDDLSACGEDNGAAGADGGKASPGADGKDGGGVPGGSILGVAPKALRSQDSELVIANKFVEEHARKDWIFVPTSRTGGIWKTFENGMWVDGHGGALLAVAEDCAKVGDRIRTSGSATQAQLTRARDLTGAHAAQNVLSLVRNSRCMTVPRLELDNRAMLMGVPGGYIDAKGNLCEPDPSLLITKCAGVAPLRGAPCRQWESLVWSLANDDPETFRALRSALGYTMTGTGREQVFFFLHGLDGGEGKTTFLQIISKVMGSYATMLPDGAFGVSRNDNRFAFGGMEGAWFVFSNEIEEGEEWATAKLKDKTGSGTTWIERKGVDGMEVPIHYGLWFQGNHLPRFRKPDPALRRRMIIFECRNPFTTETAIKGFADRVFMEEGPAILDWLMRARVDYLEHGLILPQAMEEARNEYLNSQDTMGQFIGDCCTFDQQAETPLDDLYDHWQFWRDCEGQERGRAGTRETFSKSLVNHQLCRHAKVTRDRPRNAEGNKIRVFRGIKLAAGTHR